MRWIQIIGFSAIAALAIRAALPQLALALQAYGGAPFSAGAFLLGFFRALCKTAATASQSTDFIGSMAACVLYAASEATRRRDGIVWALLVISPFGLLTGLFPAIEALQAWRGPAPAPVPREDPTFKATLYAIIAIITGTITAAFMFEHFGPRAWLAVFDIKGVGVRDYVAQINSEPAAAYLSATLGPLTGALFFRLLLDVVATRQILVPFVLGVCTMPLGVTVTVPLYLLFREIRIARQSNELRAIDGPLAETREALPVREKMERS